MSELRKSDCEAGGRTVFAIGPGDFNERIDIADGRYEVWQEMSWEQRSRGEVREGYLG